MTRNMGRQVGLFHFARIVAGFCKVDNYHKQLGLSHSRSDARWYEGIENHRDLFIIFHESWSNS